MPKKPASKSTKTKEPRNAYGALYAAVTELQEKYSTQTSLGDLREQLNQMTARFHCDRGLELAAEFMLRRLNESYAACDPAYKFVAGLVKEIRGFKRGL